MDTHETTSDKTTKLNPGLKKLLDSGIPVTKAAFHATVSNGDDVPESAFSDKSNAPGRRVMMWWTPYGLICEHKQKYFTVPLATVIYANFK